MTSAIKIKCFAARAFRENVPKNIKRPVERGILELYLLSSYLCRVDEHFFSSSKRRGAKDVLIVFIVCPFSHTRSVAKCFHYFYRQGEGGGLVAKEPNRPSVVRSRDF